MKFWIVLFIAISFNPGAQGQKHDWNWLLGYDSKPGGNPPFWGVSQLQFLPDTLLVSYVDDTPMSFFWTGGALSDTAGKLLFYTNGCYVAKADHSILNNSTGLNPGNIADFWCQSNRGYPLMQGLIILPQPERDSQFYLIHLASEKVGSPLGYIANKLYYSYIDLGALNGEGAMLEKNQILLNDTLCFGQLIAVRHGNGRDWWILMPESSSNRYYKFLLSPDGFQGPFEQRIGKIWDFRDWSGQAQFTPDGTKYLRFDTYNQLNIFDFDRCSGNLSNHQNIKINFPVDSTFSGGLAISPNSRFAYISTEYYVYQVDLQSSDMAKSQTVVARFDGFESPPGFYSLFYAAQLGPDGKIYINCTNSTDYLHVIHSPDQKGTGCGFELHGLRLAGLNAYTMPYYPNYRLYDLPQASCDTLGIDGMVGVEENSPDAIQYNNFRCRVSPNPANSTARVSIENQGDALREYHILLANNAGQVVYQTWFSGSTVDMNLQGYEPGIYQYRIITPRSRPVWGKLVIAR